MAAVEITGGLKKSGESARTESVKPRLDWLELGPVQWVSPTILKFDPNNKYPPISRDDLVEFLKDIKRKGVLVPLIVRMDNVVIAGRNRLSAALENELPSIPIQRIISRLDAKKEQEIRESENDRRRHWTKDQKETFIESNFGDEIKEEKRGGKEGSKKSDLPERIAKASGGQITKESARKHITDVRKKIAPKKDKPKGINSEITKLESDLKKTVAKITELTAKKSSLEDKIKKLKKLKAG